ncbi:hypothetical protein A4D02_10520 [Niastella koreensis]|uniref:Zinc-ribbon 15 domain-containing protein n=2 Tax=Niastella koreensis TaxID=354356 RepID=G8TR68_NIAKG|nr:hypothetical protein [Niastella koreensis]AEV98982.1 hypothetical protein Niako_2643 [Niastella koreensis GR20-10]OQP43903.1 hypothetical protein A4D02_10520 [Niastella koreensis]
MLLVHGKKLAKIKEFTDNTQACTSCKSFDLRVKIFKQYQHVYMIPVYPVGDKVVEIRCKQCDEPILQESLKKEYAKKGRAPFYFYSLFILIALIIGWAVYADGRDKKNTALWVASPRAGDVYIIKREKSGVTLYSFLKAANVAGDSIQLYQNHLEYTGKVTALNNDDYFELADMLSISKQGLQQLLDKGLIDEVKRDYDEADGFNRLK